MERRGVVITADNITDEQIRELREAEVQWIDAHPAGFIGNSVRYDDWFEHSMALYHADVARGHRRARKGGSRAKSRARCAEILNARAKATP